MRDYQILGKVPDVKSPLSIHFPNWQEQMLINQDVETGRRWLTNYLWRCHGAKDSLEC